jgi:hypothetical protein
MNQKANWKRRKILVEISRETMVRGEFLVTLSPREKKKKEERAYKSLFLYFASLKEKEMKSKTKVKVIDSM